MQTDTRLQTSNYATEPVTKAPAWHGLVAWDMLLNGMTTGLFWLRRSASWWRQIVSLLSRRAAYPVAQSKHQAQQATSSR